MKTEILKLVKDNVNERQWRMKSPESFMPRECMSEYKIFFTATLFVRVYVTYEIC